MINNNQKNELEEKAKKTVDKLISDISGRKGIGDEWDSINSSIQEEIKETWTNIIIKEIKE